MMSHFGKYFGWRQVWLLSLMVCMGLVVHAVLTLFPSRAELAQSYLAQATEVEKRFDFSLRNKSPQQLIARYAGIAPEEAVTRIRDRLRRAYGESLTRAGLLALNDRNREASRRAVADPLLLNDRPELTPEALANMHSELEQLARRYESRAMSLPAQRRKALRVRGPRDRRAAGFAVSAGRIIGARWSEAARGKSAGGSAGSRPPWSNAGSDAGLKSVTKRGVSPAATFPSSGIDPFGAPPRVLSKSAGPYNS